MTSSGLNYFNVMPFGLKKAPDTFKRLMENVLEELRGNIWLVYLDSIDIDIQFGVGNAHGGAGGCRAPA